MSKIAHGGRTVVFVSHNLTAVQSLCTKALVLQDGRVVKVGRPDECLDHYLAEDFRSNSLVADLAGASRPLGWSSLHVDRVQIRGQDDQAAVFTGQPFSVELLFTVHQPVVDVALGFSIESSAGVYLVECQSNRCYGPLPRLEPGKYQISCTMQPNHLNRGHYSISVGARCCARNLDYVPGAMVFEVRESEKIESLWMDDVQGCLRLPSEWTKPQALDHQVQG